MTKGPAQQSKVTLKRWKAKFSNASGFIKVIVVQEKMLFSCLFILLTTNGPQASQVTPRPLISLPRDVCYTDMSYLMAAYKLQTCHHFSLWKQLWLFPCTGIYKLFVGGRECDWAKPDISWVKCHLGIKLPFYMSFSRPLATVSNSVRQWESIVQEKNTKGPANQTASRLLFLLVKSQQPRSWTCV